MLRVASKLDAVVHFREERVPLVFIYSCLHIFDQCSATQVARTWRIGDGVSPLARECDIVRSNDLLDEDPPIVSNFGFFGASANQTNAGLHDVLGRRYTFGARFTF